MHQIRIQTAVRSSKTAGIIIVPTICNLEHSAVSFFLIPDFGFWRNNPVTATAPEGARYYANLIGISKTFCKHIKTIGI